MPVLRRSCGSLAVLAAVFPALAGAQSPSCTTGVVDAPAGKLCGLQVAAAGEAVAVYLGIPYAEPPVGDLRWQPPEPSGPWSGTLAATRPGAMCPQPTTGCMLGSGDLPQDESCLFLNVWAPSAEPPRDGPLPVMVFIHGGTFITGSGALPIYDAATLAATGDVVVVTLNYRLGALGGLVVHDLVGNFGFRDQILALEWVQDNIASFGGDPSKVTIFGQSAGAMSVSLHLLSSTQSAGLFQAAMMESAPFALAYKSRDDALALGALFALEAGCIDPECIEGQADCIDLQCLQEKSAQELVKAESSLLLEAPVLWQGLSGLLVWTPVIDGSLLVQQPLAAAAAGKLTKPVILGTNQAEADLLLAPVSRDEYLAGLLLAFGRHAEKVLERYPIDDRCDRPPCDQGLTAARLLTDYLWTCGNRKAATYGTPSTFVYQFTQPSSFDLYSCKPICLKEVCHGEELPYVFDSACRIGVYFTPGEQSLSRSVMGYWTGFATTETPNGGARYEWPAFGATKSYLLLDESPIAVSDPFHGICEFWDEIGYDLGSPWISPLAVGEER